MDNNGLNQNSNISDDTGIFSDLSTNNASTQNNELSNSALDKQLFTDASLNNFGSQVNNNGNTVGNLANQSLQNENINTIFDTTTVSEEIKPQVTQTTISEEIKPQVTQTTISEEIKPQVTQTPVNSVTEPQTQVKTKKSKGSIVLIVFLIIIILGLGGYIVYDKFLSTPKSNEPIEEKNSLKEVKDTKLVEELRSQLVTSNKVNSLYYNNIKATEINNKNLIGFNIVKYIDDNNVPLTGTTNYKETPYVLNTTISKTNINDYINNKYNTNSSYSYISKDEYDTLINIGCSAVLSDENNYYYVTIPTGCGLTKIDTKLVKAEEDNDNIYIYDKYIKCYSEAGWMGCVNSEDEILDQDSMISCTEGSITNEKCPIQGTIEQLSNYALTKMSDKLKTFKHTFKKLDGNYFWVSSEVVE